MRPPQMKMVEVKWPLAGLNRRMGYQSQPPYTTVDSLNVQNDHYPSYRERGGSRPGLIPAFRNQLGGGKPVNMLSKLDILEASGFTFWADDFEGETLGGIWSAGSWTGVEGAPKVFEGEVSVSFGDELRAAVRDDFSPGIDAGEKYEINLYLAPFFGIHDSDFFIFARMGAGLDPLEDGVVARLRLGELGEFSGELKTYSGGTEQGSYAFDTDTLGYAASGYFTVAFDGEDVSCFWKNTLLLTQDITADGVGAGTRVGFGAQSLNESVDAIVPLFRAQYYQVGGNQRANRSLLMAASDGNLYIEGFMGEMQQVASALTLADDRRIMAQQRTQRLYISDWGDVERTPKVYNPGTGQLTLWEADTGKGTVPPNQPIIVLWRDRIIMAGGSDAPHNWYMSRVGDPLDWDYGLLDAGRAVAGTASNAGLIGEPITALMPHEDVCLWFGCYSSLWLLRGDPASGGQVDKISDSIGVVDRFAWCLTPDFQIVFLSHDGIYMIQSGCNTEGISSLSRERLPAELLNVDAKLVDVSLEYDLQRRGIHIYLAQKDSRETKHWWLDWETKSFWPISIPVEFEPASSLAYTSYHTAENSVILGGRDGTIRRYSFWDGRDDTGEEIESFIWLGPFNLGGIEYVEGILADIQAVLAKNSGSVNYEIYASSHPEGAYGKRLEDADYEGSWSEEGLNPTDNPRVLGGSAFVKLSGAEDIHWSLEALRMRVTRAGEVRYGA